MISCILSSIYSAPPFVPTLQLKPQPGMTEASKKTTNTPAFDGRRFSGRWWPAASLVAPPLPALQRGLPPQTVPQDGQAYSWQVPQCPHRVGMAVQESRYIQHHDPDCRSL